MELFVHDPILVLIKLGYFIKEVGGIIDILTDKNHRDDVSATS